MKLLRQMVECCDGNVSSADVIARVVPACCGDWWQWGSLLWAKALQDSSWQIGGGTVGRRFPY
jgi:hypothetical protein